MRDTLRFVEEKERQHTLWRSQCLNMIAAENVISPSVRKRLYSDFEHRYVNIYAPTLSSNWKAKDEKHWYEGLQYIEEVEVKCTKILQKLFGASYADYRPISGGVAIMNVWLALTKIGDILFTKSIPHGGHGEGWDDLAVSLGRKIEHYPFDQKEFLIDVDKAKKKILSFKPKMLVFGASQILFPDSIEDLKDVAEEVGAICVYDGSHVMGLIAGKRFQDPLRQSAHVLFGSSHKSFPGPQGGLVLSNAEGDVTGRLDEILDPIMLDNYHQHRVAALTVAVAEMLEFGETYADQIISNAQVLGQALYDQGFDVLCAHKGFTQTHQVLMDATEIGMTGLEAAEKLVKANIVTNQCAIPVDKKREKNSGVRLGTSEITRVGMKESEMRHIAEFFRKVLIDSRSLESVKQEVIDFTKDFQKMRYSFDEGGDAYLQC